jgi:hypothetical protein
MGYGGRRRRRRREGSKKAGGTYGTGIAVGSQLLS